jgi:uncharacterized membrane protein HdeD (DUF308 family)
MQILENQRPSSLKRSLASPATIIVAAGIVLFLLTRGSLLSLQGCIDEAATLLGPLLLAAGVVLIANYLSAGRKPQSGERIGVRHDNDMRLDL